MKKTNKIIIAVLSLVFALSISVSSVFADSYLVENGYSYLKSSDGSTIIYGYDDTSENVEFRDIWVAIWFLRWQTELF